MFGRSKDSQDVTGAHGSPATPPVEPAETGKGRPTPKRKQAEAANKRPLVPTDRKAAGKSAKAAARAQREREYAAMQTGDERYLPAKDKGPVRRYIRDYVDARWSLGEFFLPAALVLIVLQFVLASISAELALLTLVLLYVFVLAMIADSFFMWRGLKKRLVAKFGAEAIPKGATMYAVLRVFQLRMSRLPKPQVKHGQRPS